MDSLCLNLPGLIPTIKAVGSGCGGGIVEVRGATAPSQKRRPSSFGFSFKHPLAPFWSCGGGRRRSGLALDEAVLVDSGDSSKTMAEEMSAVEMETERQNGSWMWRDGELEEEELNDDVLSENGGGCSVLEDDGDKEEDRYQMHKDSFSKLLKRVSLSESKLYAQLSYLGNLAYSISKIKPANLSKYYGLRFVTSSAEETELALKAQVSGETKPNEEGKDENNKNGKINASSAAYQVVASAASYLHWRSVSTVTQLDLGI